MSVLVWIGYTVHTLSAYEYRLGSEVRALPVSWFYKEKVPPVYFCTAPAAALISHQMTHISRWVIVLSIHNSLVALSPHGTTLPAGIVEIVKVGQQFAFPIHMMVEVSVNYQSFIYAFLYAFHGRYVRSWVVYTQYFAEVATECFGVQEVDIFFFE